MWIKCKDWFIKYATGTHGKVWLGLFSFTESIFLPIPTDTFMMMILLAGDNAKRWVYYATLTMLTSVLGAVVGYFLAFWFFDVFGPALISFYSLEGEFIRVQDFLQRSVFVFTFIGAVSPIPYKLFVLTAGFMKANFITFLIASVVGRSTRLYFSAWLVYKYGRRSIAIVKKYTWQITVLSVIILLSYTLWQLLF